MRRALQQRPIQSLAVILTLLLTACGGDKQDIHQLLDARDQAVSSRNINSYSALLHNDYNHNGQTTSDVLARVEVLFFQFDTMEMSSSDRTIYFIDDNHAQCEQSYILRVKADDEWRAIAQRERLDLTRAANGWKISGGL